MCRAVDCIAVGVLQGPMARVTRTALEGAHLVHHAACSAVQVGHVAHLVLCNAAVAPGVPDPPVPVQV